MLKNCSFRFRHVICNIEDFINLLKQQFSGHSYFIIPQDFIRTCGSDEESCGMFIVCVRVHAFLWDQLGHKVVKHLSDFGCIKFDKVFNSSVFKFFLLWSLLFFTDTNL